MAWVTLTTRKMTNKVLINDHQYQLINLSRKRNQLRREKQAELTKINNQKNYQIKNCYSYKNYQKCLDEYNKAVDNLNKSKTFDRNALLTNMDFNQAAPYLSDKQSERVGDMCSAYFDFDTLNGNVIITVGNASTIIDKDGNTVLTGDRYGLTNDVWAGLKYTDETKKFFYDLSNSNPKMLEALLSKIGDAACDTTTSIAYVNNKLVVETEDSKIYYGISGRNINYSGTVGADKVSGSINVPDLLQEEVNLKKLNLDNAQTAYSDEKETLITYYENELSRLEEETTEEETRLEEEQTQIETALSAITSENESVDGAVSQSLRSNTIRLA